MGSAREEELLRQILANPDDLSVRSIYADVLQGRNEPRGEFIALELAGEVKRARDLLDRHAKSWWPEVARHKLATRNGFLERVAVGVHEIAKTARVFASEPICDLELGYLHPKLFLEQHRLHVRPRRLWLNGAGGSLWPLVLGDTSSIERLDLSRSSIDGQRPLGTAFENCRELVLANNPYLGRSVVKLLVNWIALDRIELLDLAWTGLQPEMLRDVLALELGGLRRLRVSRNPLGAEGARILAHAIAALPALRELEVLECGFDLAALAAIRAACGTRVTLAHAMPTVVAVDLIGAQLVLRRKTTNAWEVEVDGEKRAVRWCSVSADDRPGERVTQAWQIAEVAPFDALATAIASGATREFRPLEGYTIELGSELGYVYNTGVYSRESADLDLELGGSTVGVTFRSYTSVD